MMERSSSNEPFDQNESNKDTLITFVTDPDIKYRPMPDPLSVHVPVMAIDEMTIQSIIRAIFRNAVSQTNHSQRTLLAFLLALYKKLNDIEQEASPDPELLSHIRNIRQWLERADSPDNQIRLNQDELLELYSDMQNQSGLNSQNHQYPYYEMTIEAVHDDILRARHCMKQYRKEGWKPEELKLYWNLQQIENLCRRNENVVLQETNEHMIDPSDKDAYENLRMYPVGKRNHSTNFEFINKGIEQAVFDAPVDVQLIVLNFANERTPGGGFLRHSWAQEEIILYNSDGYRSLLDLKYGRMGGGYAIPEFGLAYVRNIRFFDVDCENSRLTDMMVSACYCLTGSTQLFYNPETAEQRRKNNVAKFRAFLAAAVANTIGDGSNTYLLLGPIGTGAFGNNTEEIGECMAEALSSKMMGSEGPISRSFKAIWFVSTDAWKNELFRQILTLH